MFGKGIRIVAIDSSFYMKFGLRYSTLYEGFLNTNTQAYNDNILTRRFRLKFDGYALTPKLVYKVELGISNRDIGGVSPETNGASRIILDAVLKWNFARNFYLWFGQTKLPGNRERVVSSQKLQFVDRSVLNSRFNIDRDLGIQLHHRHRAGRWAIREIVSVAKGEGRNVTIKNKQGYDVTQAFYTGEASNIQAGYVFGKDYEIAMRYTLINQDPATQRGDIDQYTIGFSKYIVGHSLKAQTDATLIKQVGRDDILMFRFQVEMAF